MVVRHKKNGIAWLTFDLFSPFPHITHASFLRHKEGSSLTFANQPREILVDNEKLVRETLSLSSPFITLNQIHSKEVILIREENRSEIFFADAMITEEPSCPLAIRHADCQAALFFDPIHNAIGAAHSGWRGSCLNIYHEVIEKMALCFNSHPKDILAAISPSLGPEKAEFINFEKELPASLWPYQIKPFHFDFWAITHNQLLSLGLLEKQIEIARLCTFSHPEDFFSYRRDKTMERHLTFIALRGCLQS